MKNKPALLIVDDEPNIRTGLQVGVPWCDIGIGNVYSAENGEVALRLMSEKDVSIVISDIRMGGMSGIELGTRINKLHPHVKIVLLSGYQEFEYAQSAIRFGAVDYLLKPVKIKTLLEKIGSIVVELAVDEEKENIVVRKFADANSISESRGLIQHEKLFGKDPRFSLLNNRFSPLTLLAVDYVNRNYMHSINVECIADYVGRSKNYFSSQFKKDLGISFVEYLTQVRVEQARLLLKSTTMMTYEISEKVGFSDYKYFSTVFRKSTGLSPSQYRTNNYGEN